MLLKHTLSVYQATFLWVSKWPFTELIITSGGENIPPVLLEANIVREIPFLSNIMIIGDKRKYLTCVMTLKVSSLCC